MSPNAGGGEGSCGVSANEYSLYTGAQINFGDLTAYLTYVIKSFSTLQRTNTKNSKQLFPKKELRGHSPDFRSAYSAAGNMWTDPGNT